MQLVLLRGAVQRGRSPAGGGGLCGGQANPEDDRWFRRLFLSEEPAHADLALILGSSDPAEAARRAGRGATLYAAGCVPRLLLSGGDPAGRGSSEAAAMAAEVARQGVPPAAVLVEPDSYTTVENMLRSRELLDRASLLTGLRRMLLVSSWWHLRRARWLAGAVFGPEVRLICCAVDSRPDPASWAQTPEGRRAIEFELELLTALETDPSTPDQPITR